MAEVKVLKDWGREADLRKKWMHVWDKLGARIVRMPKWMQVIILQDVNTAIENRIATMEMILNATRTRRTGRT